MSEKIKLALVGIGAIARSQHLPAISASGDFLPVAAVSRHVDVEGLTTFRDLSALLASAIEIDAVSFCTPPQGRVELARTALEAGKHVMLEKPPGMSAGEIAALAGNAESAGLSLYASWHSRAAAGVEPARDWLADKFVRSVRIDWQEDVRIWHPGQEWIWQPGGLGVFDPGINALSIATYILRGAISAESAEFLVPENRAAPIAARLRLGLAGASIIGADFDFRREGAECWRISVETDRGPLLLSSGGAKLHIDGEEICVGTNREYPSLYERFAALIRSGMSDVDLVPLQIVADAFLIAERRLAPPFYY